jgi:hypothetical protein
MTDTASLVSRLRAVESGSPDFLGDDEGRCVTCWHRNPDGPEAADHIEAQADEIARLREALGQIAEMTDIEADFDGFESREIARAALKDSQP